MYCLCCFAFCFFLVNLLFLCDIGHKMEKMFVLILILLTVSGVYSDGHSLQYYVTVVSAPEPGLHEYSSLEYVDDQETTNYNSDSSRTRPMVQWMEKVDLEYWEEETQLSKRNEAVYKQDVRTAMSSFNQTGGFHVYQRMSGCELGDDGTITVYYRLGYDGSDYSALDTRTWTYVPIMAQAQIFTQRWNRPEVQRGKRQRNILENICIRCLKKHLEIGRKDLERRVRPQVKVSGEVKGGILKLHCQVYGFHPRAVDVKWMKNGEDEVPPYYTTHVLPNPDGTYQIRVSAEVIPKEGDRYFCNVDHSSLDEELNIEWQPNQDFTLIVIISVVIIVIIIAVVLIFAGIIIYNKKRYSLVRSSASDAGSDTSSVCSVSVIATV